MLGYQQFGARRHVRAGERGEWNGLRTEAGLDDGVLGWLVDGPAREVPADQRRLVVPLRDQTGFHRGVQRRRARAAEHDVPPDQRRGCRRLRDSARRHDRLLGHDWPRAARRHLHSGRHGECRGLRTRRRRAPGLLGAERHGPGHHALAIANVQPDLDGRRARLWCADRRNRVVLRHRRSKPARRRQLRRSEHRNVRVLRGADHRQGRLLGRRRDGAGIQLRAPAGIGRHIYGVRDPDRWHAELLGCCTSRVRRPPAPSPK